MNVKVLRVTEKEINLVAEAARISVVAPNQTAKEIIVLSTDVEYASALEHIYFTFDISEISVALSRELLEHRIASHTARSTRYMEEQGFSYYVPRELEEREGREGEKGRGKDKEPVLVKNKKKKKKKKKRLKNFLFFFLLIEKEGLRLPIRFLLFFIFFVA